MLSVVIPTYNEENNVNPLYLTVKSVFNNLNEKYEIIFVDDGSIDNTFKNLKKIANTDKKVKIIRFDKNYGQSAALSAGFKDSKGNIIITLDSDLQNDPADIPKLLKKLNEGFDVVCGWRKKRFDNISKKFPSIISNFLASHLMGLRIHDFGCTLRVYRKKVVDDMSVYGEIHRYIPALAMLDGYSVTEMEVKHHSRKYGKSKYKTFRILKGLSDLIILAFLKWFGTRPTYVFSILGITVSMIGVLSLLYLLLTALIRLNFNVFNRISFFISILMILSGIQFIIMSILSDMITKITYEIKRKKFYKIKEIVN